MKVGFYDLKNHKMVEVEPWENSIHMARFASVGMTEMYLSGRHRMPSPIWCVWDETEHASIFFLDDKPIGDEAVLNSILKLMV
jgi:hypothetical protein